MGIICFGLFTIDSHGIHCNSLCGPQPCARIRWSYASHSFIHIFQGRCTSMAFFAISPELVNRQRLFPSSNFIQYLLDLPYLECVSLADCQHNRICGTFSTLFFPHLNEWNNKMEFNRNIWEIMYILIGCKKIENYNCNGKSAPFISSTMRHKC